MITVTLPLSWALDHGKHGMLYICKAPGPHDVYGVSACVFTTGTDGHDTAKLAAKENGYTIWECPIQVCNGAVSSVSVAHNMPESNRWHGILNVPTIADRIILKVEQEIAKFLPQPSPEMVDHLRKIDAEHPEFAPYKSAGDPVK